MSSRRSPREQDALVRAGNLGQLLILEIVAVEAIKTQHTQVGGQAAEMIVEDEAWAEMWNPLPESRRKDPYPVAILGQVLQAGGFLVDGYLADFGMRHAEGFDQVLDGLPVLKRIGKDAFAQFRQQEKLQFGGKIKTGGGQLFLPIREIRKFVPFVILYLNFEHAYIVDPGYRETIILCHPFFLDSPLQKNEPYRFW